MEGSELTLDGGRRSLGVSGGRCKAIRAAVAGWSKLADELEQDGGSREREKERERCCVFYAPCKGCLCIFSADFCAHRELRTDHLVWLGITCPNVL